MESHKKKSERNSLYTIVDFYMESYRIIPNAIPSIDDSTVKTKLIKLKKVADDIHL
jgi:hypothetical protein